MQPAVHPEKPRNVERAVIDENTTDRERAKRREKTKDRERSPGAMSRSTASPLRF